MRTLFINGKLYTSDQIIENGRMLVNTLGQIEAIVGPELAAASDVFIQDLKGLAVFPGFIDVHVHGGNGFQMMEGTCESLDGMSKFHAAHGTTSFLGGGL